MVVTNSGSCHSDRNTLPLHFCHGSFNQRTRGDCRSLKDLLSALSSIRVEPCLLQNAARHISGCYGDLCAAEINGNHKVVCICIERAVIHQWVHPLSEPHQADTSASSGFSRYSSLISLGPKGQVCSTKRAQKRYATTPTATQASESN